MSPKTLIPGQFGMDMVYHGVKTAGSIIKKSNKQIGILYW
jgi:hypothetical protein